MTADGGTFTGSVVFDDNVTFSSVDTVGLTVKNMTEAERDALV